MIINDQNYVDKAEHAIVELSQKVGRNGRPIPMVTTSQIRVLLAMVSDIYNDVQDETSETLSNDIIGRINYMKVRFYYQAGREPKVKDFLETAQVFDVIGGINGKRDNFLLFSRYMEALVAFHKYYGGKD